MSNAIYVFWFLVLTSVTSGFCQGDFSSKNLRHYYDQDAEIRMTSKVVNYDSKTLLFLKLTINESRTRIADLVTFYAFLDGYADKIEFATDTITLQNFHQFTDLDSHYFRFEIANENKNKLLVVKILNKSTGNEFFFDIPSDPDAMLLNSGIILKWPDQPIPFHRNYVLAGEQLNLLNLGSADSTLFVYHYTSNFKVADPPFSASSSTIIRSIEIDSLFEIKSNRVFKLSKPGLYFTQSDTVGVNGVAFRVEPAPFPKQGTFKELIGSLTYFTTRTEMEKLTSAKDKKKAFDSYWISITKSSERARKVIKGYYGRVRLANQLFTTYKQGWKTDKGMIFIVFGSPDLVTRNGNREEWVFERSNRLPRMSFTFVRSKSIFTQDHYVLLRNSSYQQIWYKAIDLWRKGQMSL